MSWNTTVFSSVIPLGATKAISAAVEVADAAVFLSSDLGRGVTGNVIYVDAGFHIMGLPVAAGRE
mgnify:CR=1 FL=1